MRGGRLRDAREALGLSRGQLAEKLHVHVSTIGHWETGRRDPSNEMLAALSRELEVPADYLLGLDDLSQDSAPEWRKVDSIASQDVVGGLLRVWQAIQHDPAMQEFIVQLAGYDDETIRKVLSALDALTTAHRQP
jgi:transcriptional regulator with XRE-family HTH domain